MNHDGPALGLPKDRHRLLRLGARASITLVAAAFALVLAARADAAAPMPMICVGPDGEYLVGYDSQSGFVTFDGEWYPVMMPPESSGGITIIFVGSAPVTIEFSARQIWFMSADTSEVLGQHACHPAPPEAMQEAGAPDLEVAATTPSPPSAPADSRPTFQDCESCPVMVEIPPGRFVMGSSEADKAVPFTEFDIPQELPQHEVVIDYPFAIGKYEVTVAEFDAYVRETGAAVGGKCLIRLMEQGPDAGRFKGRFFGAYRYSPFLVAIADGSYAQPGLPVTDRQPAVCVSREEMMGYLGWLSARTGREYRLPSEAEWEYAARAGTQTVGFWGDDLAEACAYANSADRLSGYQGGVSAPCTESVRPAWTAEAGSYLPNPWGLHDMLGNVQELLADCWHNDYQGAPADGSAWIEPGCLTFVARGGDYELPVQTMRVAHRLPGGFLGPYVADPPGEFPVWDTPEEAARDGRHNLGGFRVAASLGPSP